MTVYENFVKYRGGKSDDGKTPLLIIDTFTTEQSRSVFYKMGDIDLKNVTIDEFINMYLRPAAIRILNAWKENS
jgi:hypothetical protein